MCFRVAGVQLLAEQPILEEDNPATFKENQNNTNQNKFFSLTTCTCALSPLFAFPQKMGIF